MKMLIYCTKSKKRLFFDKVKEIFTLGKVKSNNDLNGKIVAECDYEVEEIQNKLTNNNSHLELFTNQLSEEDLFNQSCLSRYEMFNYLQKGFTNKSEPKGYAIHIKNLHIFDKPKELQLYSSMREENRAKEKAPQNMCNVYYDEGTKHYILISIRPEWLCKILNGEKTIECRKRVLKEMISKCFITK